MSVAPVFHNNIPREILKWLQTLELTHTIKDAKFDLANGYFFAQMLQRYHPNIINIHSYENKSKLESRMNNWLELHKQFKKMDFAVHKSE